MKVVILLGSPTDMYLDISRSKWIGEPNYFLSALLQHFSAALFSLLPPKYFIICLSPLILLPFYSWTLFYFLWNSALLPTSLFLSSVPIFCSFSFSQLCSNISQLLCFVGLCTSLQQQLRQPRISRRSNAQNCHHGHRHHHHHPHYRPHHRYRYHHLFIMMMQ